MFCRDQSLVNQGSNGFHLLRHQLALLVGALVQRMVPGVEVVHGYYHFVRLDPRRRRTEGMTA